MEVFLVRHTTPAVAPGVCYGQADVPLAATFAAECEHVRACLPATFDRVFSSPAQRCLALAQQLASPVEVAPALWEASFGEWELQPWASLDPTALAHWMADFVKVAPPGGESLEQLYARTANFFAGLRGPTSGRTLVVAHAGVIRCAWAYLLGVPLGQVFKLAVGYGEILHYRLAPDPAADQVLAKWQPNNKMTN
jgi:alpha-ribazole phosphatase